MVKLTDNIVYGRTKSATESVRRLNLWGCDIDDISLCAKMAKLEILSISVNRVQTLEPLAHCSHLQELYLRKNEIEHLSELEHVKGLEQLRVLWLDENPCANDDNYRRKVLQMLPRLTMLDNKGVTQEEVEAAQRPSPPASIYHDHSRQSSFDRSHMSVSLISDADTNQHSRLNELAADGEYAYISSRDVLLASMSNSFRMSQTDQSPHNETTPVSEVAFYDPIAPPSMLSNSLLLDSIHENVAMSAVPSDQAHYWEDFTMEETGNSAMSQSARTSGEEWRRHPTWFSRSCTMPRRRASSRSRSISPSRQRYDNIVAAISALLDELDQCSLRAVVEEAQRRIKKQR